MAEQQTNPDYVEIDMDCSQRPFFQDAESWAKIVNNAARQWEYIPVKWRAEGLRAQSVVLGHIHVADAEGDKVVALVKLTAQGKRSLLMPACWGGQLPRPAKT